VGNPVVDGLASKLDFDPLARWEVSAEPLIAIFPGSRDAEIDFILPAFLSASALIRSDFPGARFVLALAPTVDGEKVLELTAGAGFPVEVRQGENLELMRTADLGLVKSGTATLEAALLGLPQVIVYKTSVFTWEIGVRLAKVKWLGLPNLIFNGDAVPELLQYQATSAAIASRGIRLLKDREWRQQVIDNMTAVRLKVGPPGAGERAAEAMAEFLQEKGLA